MLGIVITIPTFSQMGEFIINNWQYVAAAYGLLTLPASIGYTRRVFSPYASWSEAYQKQFKKGIRPVGAIACAPTAGACIALRGIGWGLGWVFKNGFSPTYDKRNRA